MRSNLNIHIYNFTFFSSQFAHGTHFQDKNKTGTDLVSENTTGRPLTHMCKWRLLAKTFAQCPVTPRLELWHSWCHLSRVNTTRFPWDAPGHLQLQSEHTRKSQRIQQTPQHCPYHLQIRTPCSPVTKWVGYHCDVHVFHKGFSIGSLLSHILPLM